MDASPPEPPAPPTYWTLPDPRWRPLGRWITWEMVVLGFFLSVVLAWYSIGLIGSAWAACDEAEPPYLFGLVFVIFPAMALVAWVAFTIGAVVTERSHDIVRYAAGTLLAVAICLLVVTFHVPIRDDYDASPSTDPLMIECGANGIPTWWPSWLPS